MYYEVTVWRFKKTWRTCSHERRTRDVIGEMERIADDFQNRNEEIVTDDRQRQDQVRRNDDVDDDPALSMKFYYGF
jgi:hypothetical protein